MIRVLIADDQRLFGESLSTTLRNYAKDIDVVGLASDGAEAIELVGRLSPDIVLMDVFMPRLDGVEATRSIMARWPAVRILMLSTYDEDTKVKEALSLGAAGYLLKDITPVVLIASIRALSSGVMQISPQIVARLMQGALAEGDVPDRRAQGGRSAASRLADSLTGLDALTSREREVLALIADGFDNTHIASELCLAEHTVRNHVSAIYAKLEVQDRFQIIQMAKAARSDR